MNPNPTSIKPYVSLATPRLILDGLRPQEMQVIFENYSQLEIKTILGHRTDEAYLKEEHKYKNGYAAYNRSFVLFLLKLKETGKIIGRCGIHNWNQEHQRAEIGYNMEDESYQQQGLMSEAVEAILHYGFDTLQLNRMEALVGKNNVPSLKIIEKNGFKQEGILQQHMYIQPTFQDSLLFALLREDYLKSGR